MGMGIWYTEFYVCYKYNIDFEIKIRWLVLSANAACSSKLIHFKIFPIKLHISPRAASVNQRPVLNLKALGQRMLR